MSSLICPCSCSFAFLWHSKTFLLQVRRQWQTGTCNPIACQCCRCHCMPEHHNLLVRVSHSNSVSQMDGTIQYGIKQEKLHQMRTFCTITCKHVVQTIHLSDMVPFTQRVLNPTLHNLASALSSVPASFTSQKRASSSARGPDCGSEMETHCIKRASTCKWEGKQSLAYQVCGIVTLLSPPSSDVFGAVRSDVPILNKVG